MQLFKNTASQKIRVFAFADAGHATLDAGEPVTGDAGNITARTALDNAALGASNDVNPTEVDATNAKGVYEFDPTQAETNGDVIEWYPQSSTAGVQVVTIGGSVQILQPPNLPSLGIASDGDLTKVNTLDGHTAQTGDSFARLGAPAGASVSADIADVPTVAEFNARTLAAADYFDPAADTVANVTTVATLTGHTAQTGDSFARLGAPAGASVSADIAAMKVDTAAILIDTSTTLDNLVDDLESRLGVPVGADISADIAAVKAETALIVADTNELQTDWADGGRLDLIIDAAATSTALATAQADLDTLTGADGVLLATTGQPTGWPANLQASAGQIINGTVDTVTNTHTPTTTEFQADDITEATTDHYKGRIVIFTSGVLAGQATDITAYAAVGGIGQFTVTAMTEAPSNNDTFIIV